MDFDTYLRGTNDELHNYNEFINQTLRDGLGPNGFTLPPLTTAQANAIMAMTYSNGKQLMPNGTTWFNSSLAKLQFLASWTSPILFTIETVTSV